MTAPPLALPVPAWLVAPEPLAPPYAAGGRRRRRSFVDRTLDGSARVLRQIAEAQGAGAGRGLLRRLDPRVTLVSMLALLLALAVVRHPTVLLVAWFGTAALAGASGVPVRSFLVRAVAAPLVAAVVVAPATLSVVTPGLVVVPLWTWAGAAQA